MYLKPLYTIEEAATILSVDTGKVNELIADKKIQSAAGLVTLASIEAIYGKEAFKSWLNAGNIIDKNRVERFKAAEADFNNRLAAYGKDQAQLKQDRRILDAEMRGFKAKVYQWRNMYGAIRRDYERLVNLAEELHEKHKGSEEIIAEKLTVDEDLFEKLTRQEAIEEYATEGKAGRVGISDR